MPVLVLGDLHSSVLFNWIAEHFQVSGYTTILYTKYRLNVAILLEYRFYMMVNNLRQYFHARANMDAEYKSYLHFLSKTIYFKETFCLGIMERIGWAILSTQWGIPITPLVYLGIPWWRSLRNSIACYFVQLPKLWDMCHCPQLAPSHLFLSMRNVYLL